MPTVEHRKLRLLYRHLRQARVGDLPGIAANREAGSLVLVRSDGPEQRLKALLSPSSAATTGIYERDGRRDHREPVARRLGHLDLRPDSQEAPSLERSPAHVHELLVRVRIDKQNALAVQPQR